MRACATQGCTADISHRGTRAEFCEPCARERQLAGKREYNRKWRSKPENKARQAEYQKRYNKKHATDPEYRARMSAYSMACRERAEARGAEMYASGGRDFPEHYLTREVQYVAAHNRVRYVFGKATSHPCEAAGCDSQAHEWALIAPDSPYVRSQEVPERNGVGTRVVRYSLRPTDYRPLCRSHHTQLDRHGALAVIGRN